MRCWRHMLYGLEIRQQLTQATSFRVVGIVDMYINVAAYNHQAWVNDQQLQNRS